jgi:hypothetical protein
MSNSNEFCITVEPGDSDLFGISVAINDKYLAVGDPIANRVIIYTLDIYGQWIRTKQILPPANFIDFALGEHSPRFGDKLELDGDVLIIEASIMLTITSEENFLPRVKDFVAAYSPKRYLIRLDTETKITEIELLIKKTIDSVELNLLKKGVIEQAVIPNYSEERFGYSIALHQNLLLIGSPSNLEEGKAWLFDLDRLESKPLKLATKDIDLGETVAISKYFAVVSSKSRLQFQPAFPNKQRKTLIRNLKNSSTTIINSYGELSLSENILAVMRSGSYKGSSNSHLEIFRLDENTVPQLMIERNDVSKAWVQNGFLVTVKHPHDFSIPNRHAYSSICIEAID